MFTLIIAVVLLSLIYIQPKVITATIRHPLGRVLLTVGAILAALIQPILGILMVGLLIVSGHREGFDTKPGTSTGVPKFRSDHCTKMNDGSSVLIGPTGDKVIPSNVVHVYPSVRFAEEPCNPCDSDCHFDLLGVEEGLRNPPQKQEDKPSDGIPVLKVPVPKAKPLSDPKPLPNLQN
jgi:hypothetical protein